jgi:hypothetical protein
MGCGDAKRSAHFQLLDSKVAQAADTGRVKGMQRGIDKWVPLSGEGWRCILEFRHSLGERWGSQMQPETRC